MQKLTALLTISIMFWNLENFFDTRYDGISDSEQEFSAYGSRHWGSRKYKAKCSAVAKTAFVIGEKYESGPPDILCFAEVENRKVLQSLIWNTPLRKMSYRVVHFESPDPRGIDCGLLYNNSKLKLVKAFPKHIEEFKTRDLLVAQFIIDGTDSLAVIVNHHPSKYGGNESSDRRFISMQTLKDLTDSLCSQGWTYIAAVGDFNDVPDAPQFGIIQDTYVNLAESLWRQGTGSIKFDGSWELIDIALVTPDIAKNATMRVCDEGFLLERDTKHSGYKPRRTYSGPRYKGGVSDHLPILLSVNF